MNHKRKRPQSQRAGCKLCKPWKESPARRDVAKNKPSELRKLQEPVPRCR